MERAANVNTLHEYNPSFLRHESLYTVGSVVWFLIVCMSLDSEERDIPKSTFVHEKRRGGVGRGDGGHGVSVRTFETR